MSLTTSLIRSPLLLKAALLSRTSSAISICCLKASSVTDKKILKVVVSSHALLEDQWLSVCSNISQKGGKPAACLEISQFFFFKYLLGSLVTSDSFLQVYFSRKQGFVSCLDYDKVFLGVVSLRLLHGASPEGQPGSNAMNFSTGKYNTKASFTSSLGSWGAGSAS